MNKISTHFIVEESEKVVFFIKGFFTEHLILKNYMPFFPKYLKVSD